jgi:hypothetical protein
VIIDVEEKLTGDIWHGDYTMKYIEDITSKAGAYKKFGIFIKMLISAANQSSVDQ